MLRSFRVCLRAVVDQHWQAHRRLQHRVGYIRRVSFRTGLPYLLEAVSENRFSMFQ